MTGSGSRDKRSSHKRVFIIHPLVPEYRQALYEHLYQRLQRHDIELIVLNGEPSPRIRDRHDRIHASWSKSVHTQWFRIGSKELGYRSIRYSDFSLNDYVIVEQALKNIETFPLLFLRLRGRIHLGMWGHGKTYSVKQSHVVRKIKTWITGFSERIFVYTENGKRYLLQSGLPSEQLWVLNNSIDTDQLKSDLASVTDDEILEFETKHGLTTGHTGIFIGGVDESKGIDFLVASAKLISDLDPQFRLLIVGEPGTFMSRHNLASA